MVEQIEKFRPEIQAHILPRQSELLDDGEVCVDEVRTVNGYTAGVAKLTARRLDKAGRVYELDLGLVGVETASTNLVGTVKVVAVASGIEGNVGIVQAVDQWVDKARSDLLDQRQLPATQN